MTHGSHKEDRPSSTRSRIALACGATLVGLLLAEIFVRVVNPVGIVARGDKIVLPVNRRFRINNEVVPGADSVSFISRNAIGFRGPPPPADFESQTTIVTVGGSTTACTLLSDGNTWPDRLAQRLSTAARPVWVNNAGLDGHSTLGHIRLLEQVICPLHPDVCVFLTGVNDVGRDDLRDKFDNRLLPAHQSWRNWILSQSAMLYSVQSLWRASRVINLDWQHSGLDLRSAHRIPALDPAQRERELALHRKEYVPGYQQRLMRMVRLCKQASIQPVLITQPALYGEVVDATTGTDLSELRVQRRRGDETISLDAATAWDVLRLYNRATRGVAAEAGVKLIDLAEKLPKDSMFFYDWVHFSRKGAAKVAELVGEELVAALPAAE